MPHKNPTERKEMALNRILYNLIKHNQYEYKQ